MSASAGAPEPSRSGFAKLVRLALRDLRGGLAGFGVFIACIVLGVAAITGVGSVARGLGDGLARQGRTILGGDISFALTHRELSAPETAYLHSLGSVNEIALLRAMARKTDGTSALIEIKVVGTDYPAIGTLKLAPQVALSDALAQHDGVFGLVADTTLMARLGLKIGDTLSVGETRMTVRATLTSEPDRLAAGVGFGPRVLISADALKATSLVQPGSLIRYVYRLALQPQRDDLATQAVATAAAARFPEAGWEVRTRMKVSPQFDKNLGRFTQFLTLVGLTALIVGGVGIANAVRAYLDRKRGTVATLKAVGATGGFVFGLMLVEVMLVACLGIAIGLAVGAAIPFVLVAAFGSVIPFPIAASLYPDQLAAGAVYGLLTALTFVLLPLGRTHDIPVSALFRDEIEPDVRRPRARYIVMAAAAAAALAAFAIGFAYDRALAAFYGIAVVAAFVLLRGVAAGVMAGARLLPRFRRVELRLAVTNIYRPGALTPSVVLSLGLGLALLVTLTLIEGNIRSELETPKPGETPSFFFVDVNSSQAGGLRSFLASHAPGGRIEEVPFMRGRIVKVRDVPAEKVSAKDSVAWVLDGDRGITYAATVPAGTRLTRGSWWASDYRGPPLVSLEQEVADGLGLRLGDTLTVNVLGRNVTVTIANLRKVNWRSFGINFVLVFSPNTFAGAPHTDLLSLTFPRGSDVASETTLLKSVAATFPTVTSVRVKDALDTINGLVAQLGFAVRGAAGVALAASVLVLAGAVAAGRRARTYDAVVLKTLGATRMRLLAAFVLEYALIGSATAVFGVLAGGAGAWFIVARLMQLDFVWLWSTALAATAIALTVTVGLGLAGTFRILGRKPAAYLRNL